MIPDYQRPYSWENEQCETLWADICAFAFPFDHAFNPNGDQYFLGTILTFPNSSYESEVIDGHQRLVTFMLMLRAFYQAFGSASDESISIVRRKIEQCLWHTDEDEKPDKESLKLKYEIIADEDSRQLKRILTTGESDKKIKAVTP